VETHSNKIFVGFVVALLIAAFVAFALWMTANKRSSGRPYDIIITQSVSGLLVGSPVTFLGVPVGRVTSVELDTVQPDAIRVRIDVTDDELPITQGTVARLSGDLLFGAALLSLQGGSPSAPPLVARAGEDAPRIPLETGGMADLVSDPTPMVESIAYATDRLLAMTSPEQQEMLTARLEDMARSSAEMAARAPMLGSRVAETRQSLRDSTASAADFARRAERMDRAVNGRGRTASRELRSSLAAAREATTALDQRLEAARPSVRGLSQRVAETGETIAGAREGVAGLREQVQQVERGGVGGLISGPPTPDYRPPNRR
jgi:phospholipid/cholesterol/gamma-HCH transport system substrate-binding protein